MTQQTSREKILTIVKQIHVLLTGGKTELALPIGDDIDTEKLETLGEELFDSIRRRYPPRGDYYPLEKQDYEVGGIPESLKQEIIEIIHISKEVLGRDKEPDDDNIFRAILSDFVEIELDYAELEDEVRMRFDSYLDDYHELLELGALKPAQINQVHLLLDVLATMTSVCTSGVCGRDRAFPEARLTREEEERFRASESRLNELGIETQNHDHLGNRANFQILAQLGAEKGYWEGFKGVPFSERD